MNSFILFVFVLSLTGCNLWPSGGSSSTPSVAVSLSTSISTVYEGTSLHFTITPQSEVTRDSTVSISYSSPVASDTASAPIQVSIPQGQTSVDVTITIPQDGVYQSQPRTLQISAPSGIVTSDTLSFQIINADPFPNIQLTGSPSLEGSTATVTVALDAPVADDIDLSYTLSPNTAPSSAYVGTGGTVEIPAGSLSAMISIPLNTNGACDGTQDFVVTLTPPSDSTQGPVDFQQDILENSPVTYSLNSVLVVEGSSGNLTLTSDLSCPFSRTLSFSSTDGTALAGTNYNALANQTVTLPASQNSVGVPFQSLNDLIQSPTKDFSVSMVTASYGAVAGTGTVQITDTNPTPTLQWTAATKSITRSSTTTTIAWSLSKASGYDIQATVLLSGAATRGTDYEVNSTTLTIPAGTASGSFEVQIFASTVYDGDRTVILTLDSMDHANPGTILTNTLTLADVVPTVSISGTASLTEGASGNYTVALSKASTSTITVDYSTLDGTASSSTDYTSNAATLTFAPSEQNKSVTVSTLDNATVCQANRTFSIFVSNPSGATLSTISSASTVIQDDDYPTLSSVDFSVSENSSSANFTATLPQACGYNVQYSWTTVNGTAISGTDYIATNGTVVIPAGTVSITRSVTLKDDNVDQGNRYFYVQFSNPTKVVLPSSSTKITITDDESPPTLSFSQSSATALDSVGSFSLTATLSHPTTQAVTASISLGGTAVYNQDYTASSLSVSIPAGSTSQTIALFPVRGTGGKTIGLTLGTPNHGSLGSPSSFTLTLQEDPFIGPLIASSADSSLILYLSALNNGSAVPLSLGTTTTSAGVRVSKAPGSSPKVTDFSFSGDQQRALFLGNNNRASDLDLFSVRTDGSLLTQLNSTGWVSGRSVQKFRSVGATAKVIFLADRVSGGATADLYTVNTDSSALQNLVPSVNGTKTIFDFDVTASGSKVVFLSDLQGVKEIYSISPDGSGLVKLNSNLAAGSKVDQFAITPDSSKVVFTVKDSSGNSALYVAPIGSGSMTMLNQNVGSRTVKSFKVSPDSAKVAYVHNYTSASNFDLFNVNINGSSRIQINQNLVSGGSVTDYGFAPNSLKLYFLAEAQVISSPELYTANLDGTSLAKLNGTLPSGGRIDRAAFTPNSSLVIYLGHQDSASTQELYSVGATGSGRVKLNLTPVSGGQITQFLITKDSSKVVYLGDQEDLGVAEVFVVNTNGSQLMCISSTALVSGKKADSVFLPPSSSRVLYRANQDDSSRYDWYSVNLDGGMLTKAFAP